MLLDTNILIDHLRDRTEAVEFLEKRAAADKLISSVICRAEILNGMRPEEKARTVGFLGLFEWLPLGSEIADISSEYFRKFHHSHGLNFFDSLIAGTAKFHGLRLCTANKKHYPMKDIRVEQPY